MYSIACLTFFAQLNLFVIFCRYTWCFDKPKAEDRKQLIRAIEIVSVKFILGYFIIGLIMTHADILKYQIIGWIIMFVSLIYVLIIFWWRFNFVQWWRVRLNCEAIQSVIEELDKNKKEIL